MNDERYSLSVCAIVFLTVGYGFLGSLVNMCYCILEQHWYTNTLRP
jgi:hypothetical protein